MISAILLGDSSFDNTRWVKDKEATVTAQLKSNLTKGDSVINLAVDGFTTADVLNGANMQKAFQAWDADAQHPDKMFYPLQKLAEVAETQEPTHIFISVGGNDLRESLQELVFTDSKKRVQRLINIMHTVQNNFRAIVDKVIQTCPNANITMMLQYTPCVKQDSYFIYYLMLKILQGKSLDKESLITCLDVFAYDMFGKGIKTEEAAVKQLHAIMQATYGPMIDYARENKIPVLDMTTTFDNTNKQLYVAQIEPSQQGAALIAEMMTHVIKTHDFTGLSAIYVKPGCATGPIIAIKGEQPWQPHSILSTDDNALDYFNAEYARKWQSDRKARHGLYKFFSKRNPSEGEISTFTLEEIKEQANKGNKKILAVMDDLGWLEKSRKAGF